MHVLKMVLLVGGTWAALAVVVWFALRAAKKVVAGHPRWTTQMEAEPTEDDLYVDTEGPFGWIRGK